MRAMSPCTRTARGSSTSTPVVGDLDLAFDAVELPADTGLTMTAYAAEPGTASADGLSLLASWSASLEQLETPDEAKRT
jgi:hypothetical protein